MDPTAGAGIIRDERSCALFASSLRVQCVATALTRQGLGTAAYCSYSHAEYLRQRLRTDSSAAWKIGLLPNDRAQWVRAALQSRGEGRPLVVLDPVLGATQGGDLGVVPEKLLELFGLCDLVTPNYEEFSRLVAAHPHAQAMSARENIEVLIQNAVLLSETSGVLGISDNMASKPRPTSWLIKSFALEKDCIADILVLEDQAWRIRRRRRDPKGPNPRGTGCALASTIACAWLLASHTQAKDVQNKEIKSSEISLESWHQGQWRTQDLGRQYKSGPVCLRATLRGIAWLDRARQHLHPGPDGRFHLPSSPSDLHE